MSKANYEEEKNNYLTKLYSASSHKSTGTLSESINNFYGVLVVAHNGSYNMKGSAFLSTELCLSTNIIASIMSNNIDMGAGVIIGSDGISLDLSQTNAASYINAIYGVFRK